MIAVAVNRFLVCHTWYETLGCKSRVSLRAGIYKGNPKWSTDRPTAKRLLRQFRDISLVIVTLTQGTSPQVFLTDLTKIQLKILKLLGFEPNTYTGLTENLKLLFLESKISEI